MVNNHKTVPAGFEPATYRLTADRSNQLSYGTLILYGELNPFDLYYNRVLVIRP